MAFALAGLREGWRTEASFRGHVWRSLVAVAAMLIVRPAPIWWAPAGLVLMLILALELVNSAIERLIDHLHPETHPAIGAIKDMTAAAVLLMNVAAVILGISLAVALVRG
jgi:diacylglycerol kinase (ATP)